jgi:hypothetical protein
MYSFLAAAVLVLHLLFILFVALGALLVVRWRWIAWLHVPAALWGAFVELSGGICPLTPVENSLRELAGAASYEGSFIERYLTAWIYPEGLTRSAQITIGVGVLGINATVYGWCWRTGLGRSAQDRKGNAPP